MGIYLNPGSEAFRNSLNSKRYIDKTELIEYSNQVLNTNERFICVSCPRRFGKSMTVNMLAAYYDKSIDSNDLFQNLYISRSSSYQINRNKYNVLLLNMQKMCSDAFLSKNIISSIEDKIIMELRNIYNDIIPAEEKNLASCLEHIYYKTKESFIFIVDEWDYIFRDGNSRNDEKIYSRYLSFLTDLLKDKNYVALAYMTGILPIKKYGTHSSLNMFTEYSMTNPKVFAKFIGFTENEVKALCNDYMMGLDDVKSWYGGYPSGNEVNIYNPHSVIEAMMNREFLGYWIQEDTYEELNHYLAMDHEGLKAAVIDMLDGRHVKVNTRKFQNDTTSIESKDDILTLFIHLGYLAYDIKKKEAFIPNREIEEAFINILNLMTR